MEIHLSLGVSTLVALMAAHRGDNDPATFTAFDLMDLDRISADPRAGEAADTSEGENPSAA